MHNVISLQSRREHRASRGTAAPTPEQDSAPLTYTVEQVAEILRISRSTAYRCVETGELPSVRLRRRILIPAEAIEALLSGTSPLEPTR